MSTFKGRSPLRPLFALIASGAFVAAAQVPTVAHAAEQIEEVVVTGSRIARDPNATASGPVQSLSAEDIKLSGQVDVADVLREQPALLTSTSVAGSVDGVFSSSVGQAILQLRGMGSERTLVLVDGRRHVAGVSGSQAVDIGSIPTPLIERVETLTGGASAVYGADAVTGVVNFILKDDFEGLELDFNGGISGESDGETFNFSGVFGRNFADGRGNFTIAVDVLRREGIKAGDRGFAKNNGIADGRNNPALRFQDGDIDPASTPNFAAFFNPANGFFNYGETIPRDAAQFEIDAGLAPGSLTQAELDLIAQANAATSRAIGTQHTFSISSERGVIVGSAADLSPGVDIDGNGVDDCQDSFVGFYSQFIFGGCWTMNDDGTVRPYQDGLVASFFNQFGGDGIQNGFDQDLLTPDEEKYVLNFTGRYDINDQVRVFGEAKYVRQEVEFGGPLNTFYDLLAVHDDNPFIPAELQPVALANDPPAFMGYPDSVGLFITRDPTDLGPNINKNVRETWRIVAGLEGELSNGWGWEVAANYGEFNRDLKDRNAVIQDRWFAAIDVVADPVSGEPICRSDIDPTAPLTTPFGIPGFDPGFFTFNPGDGQCRPVNLFGRNTTSQAAVDFITTTAVNQFDISQFVLSANLTGDLPFLELPGGAIAFSVGAEYREETSEATYDPLVLGVVPVDTPDASAGDLVRDLGLTQTSLVFDPEQLQNNSDDDYDVTEVFGELYLPILSDTFLAEELSVDLAGRISDYSTVGTTNTWTVGASWAPVSDARFRSTYSEAVRAPNIFELFNPGQSATFRPVDPCEQTEIDALAVADPATAAIRAANCQADGLPVGFVDPLSARFTGETGGNPDLKEETAETLTVGVVLQPRWVDGLTISVDYWDVEIDDAISAVSAQDTVDNCYDSPSFPNSFCSLFTRNRDPSSAQFLGFNFLRQTQLNFGSIEAKGIDFSGNYAFDALGGMWNIGVYGTWMDKLDFFFDPGDPSAVDPELGEVQRPEYAGQATLSYARGSWAVRWRTMYQDEQLARDAEIETFSSVFGQAAVQDEFYSHDISFSWDYNEQVQLYGGVNNLTDEEPNLQEGAWPVSPVGRYMFIGVSYQGM